MSKLRRAWEIQREGGIIALINGVWNYLKNIIRNLFYDSYYNLKFFIFGSYIVNINGVLIDLDEEVFSPATKKGIRRKGYEHAESSLVDAHIQRDRPVVELGAGVGYTACLIDKKTDCSTQIIAVEANKSLLPVIKRTKELNGCNFDVLHSAYDAENDSIEFQVAEDFWSSSQYDKNDTKLEKVTVPAVSLNDIISNYNLNDPVQLIVDIEGGEHDLINNDYGILQYKVSLIIFEFHSGASYGLEFYLSILEDIGFEYVDSQNNVYVYENAHI